MYRGMCIRVRPEMPRLSPSMRPQLSLPARKRPPLLAPPSPRNPRVIHLPAASTRIDLRRPAPDRPYYDPITGFWVGEELHREFEKIRVEMSVYEFD